MCGSMKFCYSDGGRSLYYSGVVGDCVTRSFATGLGKSYLELYELVNKISQIEYSSNKKIKGKSSATGGVYPHIISKLAEYFELKFKPKTGIVKNLRRGKYLVLTDGHMTCMLNGVNFDTHDCLDEIYLGYYRIS